MKTVLSVFCWFCIVVMLSGCDNGDDGGSSSGNGGFPDASYAILTDDDGNDYVVCYNATSNVKTGTEQTCTWNCANYNGAVRKVILSFYEDTVCREESSTTTTNTSDSGVEDTYSSTSSTSASSETDDDDTSTSSTSDSESTNTLDSDDGSTSSSTSTTTLTCAEEFTLAEENFGACVL